MIIEYHRPKNEKEALQLLNRSTPKTVAMGGGTVISKTRENLAVVDLQSLGWNKIESVQDSVVAGSCVTLESLLKYFGNDSVIGKAISIDAGRNIRQMATLGGTLAVGDGRSALLTSLLAADIRMILKPDDEEISIGKWFSSRRSQTNGKVIAQVLFPKVEHLSFESVGRSPLDLPIICCSVAFLDKSRMRIAFGGFGDQPVLAYDGDCKGQFTGGVENAVKDAGDEWASAEYRMEAGKQLANRLVSQTA